MPQCLSGPQFRTLKYCPEIPERFGSFKDGMPFCQCFFIGYNEQRHRGIAFMTPAATRHSNFEIVIQPRKKPLKEAFRMRLERSFGRIRTCLQCGQPLGSIIRRWTQKTLLSQYPSGKPRLRGYPSMSPRQIVDPGSSWRPVFMTVPLKR